MSSHSINMSWLMGKKCLLDWNNYSKREIRHTNFDMVAYLVVQKFIFKCEWLYIDWGKEKQSLFAHVFSCTSLLFPNFKVFQEPDGSKRGLETSHQDLYNAWHHVGCSGPKHERNNYVFHFPMLRCQVIVVVITLIEN